MIIVALLAVAAVGLYGQAQRRKAADPERSAPATVATPASRPAAAPAFHCDGRRFCSEMRSCEEAKFFLQNCPGTEMDGDRDGVPCERQWCTGG